MPYFRNTLQQSGVHTRRLHCFADPTEHGQVDAGVLDRQPRQATCPAEGLSGQ